MKPPIISVLICLLSACNQSTSNQEQNIEGASKSISVFESPANENADNLKHVTEELTAPPYLPNYEQHVSKESVVVEVKLTVEEKKLEIAPGVKVWALTFNGSVPGPMIVVHQNDYVQLTLVNPSTNTLAHNIDFHAATGAMGAVIYQLSILGNKLQYGSKLLRQVCLYTIVLLEE